MGGLKSAATGQAGRRAGWQAGFRVLPPTHQRCCTPTPPPEPRRGRCHARTHRFVSPSSPRPAKRSGSEEGMERQGQAIHSTGAIILLCGDTALSLSLSLSLSPNSHGPQALSLTVAAYGGGKGSRKKRLPPSLSRGTSSLAADSAD